MRSPIQMPEGRIDLSAAAFIFLMVLVSMAMTAQPLEAQFPGGLTLEEAIAAARNQNPGFQITRNDEGLADWEVRTAYGSLLPSASASSGVSWQGAGEQRFGSLTAEQLGFRDQPSHYFSNYFVGLSYTLNGSTLLAPGQAKAAREATEARTRSQEASLILDVTQAYLEVLRQDDGLRVVTQELERAEYNLRLAEGRLEVGSATPLDVKQAEIAVGRATVNVLRTQNGARTSRLRLLVRMGVDPDPDVELTTEFTLEAMEWSESDLFALALERNPSLRALRASALASDYSVRVARSRFLPTLSASAGLSGFTRQASSTGFLIAQGESQAQARVQQCQVNNDFFSRLAQPLPANDCSLLQFNDQQRNLIRERNSLFPFNFTGQPPEVSLTLSIPVFQGFARSRQVEVARVEQENVQHRLRDQELSLRAEISAGIAAVRTAFQSAVIEERNRTVADEQLQLAREQYAVGSASFLQLVEAETLKAQSDRDRIASIHAYHDTLANLEAVVGTPLRLR